MKPLPCRGSGKSPSAAPSGASVDEVLVSNRPVGGLAALQCRGRRTGKGSRSAIILVTREADCQTRTGAERLLQRPSWRVEFHVQVQRSFPMAESGFERAKLPGIWQSYSDSSRFCRAGRQVAVLSAKGHWQPRQVATWSIETSSWTPRPVWRQAGERYGKTQCRLMAHQNFGHSDVPSGKPEAHKRPFSQSRPSGCIWRQTTRRRLK